MAKKKKVATTEKEELYRQSSMLGFEIESPDISGDDEHFTPKNLLLRRDGLMDWNAMQEQTWPLRREKRQLEKDFIPPLYLESIYCTPMEMWNVTKFQMPQWAIDRWLELSIEIDWTEAIHYDKYPSRSKR